MIVEFDVCVCRCYASAKMENLPSCLQECWELLSSEPFFLLLSNLTGLCLHDLAAKDEDSKIESQCKETDAEKEEKRNHTEGQSSSNSLAKKKNKGERIFFL